MSSQRYELHRFCKAFRRADAHEKNEIIASMKGYGYDKDQPITLYEGMILDGATRQDAAGQAGVEPAFTNFTGSEAEAIVFVIRRNKARKHTTIGELDLVGARLVMTKTGGQKGSLNQISGSGMDGTAGPFGRSDGNIRTMVAKELGRNTNAIEKARELILRGATNIITMVEAGEVSTGTAADGIRGKTKEEQAQMTPADLRKIANAYKKHKPKLKPSPPVKQPSKTHVRLSDLDVGSERIPDQPVQLWPAHVQRLQEAAIRVAGVAGRITSFTSVDPNGFANDVEPLLAYQPVTGKKNGEQRDFAKEARKSLELVEKHVEEAITKLVELRTVLANRVKEEAV